jgi:hypothetical protein
MYGSSLEVVSTQLSVSSIPVQASNASFGSFLARIEPLAPVFAAEGLLAMDAGQECWLSVLVPLKLGFCLLIPRAFIVGSCGSHCDDESQVAIAVVNGEEVAAEDGMSRPPKCLVHGPSVSMSWSRRHNVMSFPKSTKSQLTN